MQTRVLYGMRHDHVTSHESYRVCQNDTIYRVRRNIFTLLFLLEVRKLFRVFANRFLVQLFDREKQDGGKNGDDDFEIAKFFR